MDVVVSLVRTGSLSWVKGSLVRQCPTMIPFHGGKGQYEDGQMTPVRILALYAWEIGWYCASSRIVDFFCSIRHYSTWILLDLDWNQYIFAIESVQLVPLSKIQGRKNISFAIPHRTIGDSTDYTNPNRHYWKVQRIPSIKTVQTLSRSWLLTSRDTLPEIASEYQSPIIRDWDEILSHPCKELIIVNLPIYENLWNRNSREMTPGLVTEEYHHDASI